MDDTSTKFHHLLDLSLTYLQQLKEESPYAPSLAPTPSKVPLPPSIQPQKPSAPEKPPLQSPPVKIPQVASPIFLEEPLTLSTPKPTEKDSLEDLRALIKKVTPSLKILTMIPSDAKAKKIKNAWKSQHDVPDVAILVNSQLPTYFLKQVAQAIELHFFPSHVIDVYPLEQADSWEAFLNTPHLKWIIAPDTALWNCKHLMRYYHENPSKKERFLGKIPVLLLPDPHLYLKDATLKRSLWNLLCQTFKPLKN